MAQSRSHRELTCGAPTESSGSAAPPADLLALQRISQQPQRRQHDDAAPLQLRRARTPLTMDELDLNRDNNAAPLLDVERGSFPIGHAGSDWGKNWDASKGTHEQMTSRDVLSILGQYDARGDIPYDQIRCGPSVLLGAAIAQGPEALSSLIRQLGEPLAAPDSREMLWLALDKQRDKLRDIEFNWHHTPAPAPMTTSSPWTSCTGSSASCSYTFLRWSRWQSTRGSSRWTYRTPPRRTAGSSPPIYAAPRSG